MGHHELPHILAELGVLADPLGDNVPRSFEGFLVSQFDKDDVEALGLAKLDVLGVRMLSTIAHTLDEVERIHGVRPDIDQAARDDPATFELIRGSATMGCFQIESFTFSPTLCCACSILGSLKLPIAMARITSARPSPT